MSVSYNKFNLFTQDLSNGVHTFSTGNSQVFKVALSNTAPVATNHLYGDVSANEVANGGGYTTGGTATTMTDSTSSGTEKVLASDVVFTGSGGGMGPFRYAYIYNTTPSTPLKPLIAWYDYGSSISLNASDTFTVDFDGSAGFFTVT